MRLINAVVTGTLMTMSLGAGLVIASAIALVLIFALRELVATVAALGLDLTTTVWVLSAAAIWATICIVSYQWHGEGRDGE